MNEVQNGCTLSRIRIGPIVRSISPFFGRPTKKVSSLRMDNFFGWPQKNEKLTRRLVGQRDWSKPHGRLYHVLIPEVRPSNLSWCHNLNTKCCNLLHFFIIFVLSQSKLFSFAVCFITNVKEFPIKVSDQPGAFEQTFHLWLFFLFVRNDTPNVVWH